MNCPRCGAPDSQSRGKRNALYPVGVLAVIGIPFAMLHQASGPRDYHCNACGLDFRQRTAIAKIAYGILLILIVALCALFTVVTLAIISGRIS